MPNTHTDALTALTQAMHAADAALADHQADPARRTEKLAGALQALPGYSLYACLLLDEGRPAVAVVDADGRRQAAWEGPVRETLLPCIGSEPAGSRDLAGVPETETVMAAPIRHKEQCYGMLAVGGTDPAAAPLLELLGERIATALHVEEALGGAEEEKYREWLGDVSETASIVAHEFNNFLNGIMLHLALVRQEAPKEIVAELDVMKRLTTDAANLVKRLQQYNSRRRQALGPVNLNHAIESTLARLPLPPGVTRIQRDLAAGLPDVQGTHRELRRLLALLVEQGGAAMAAHPGPLLFRTELGNRKVVLRFEDAGPSVDPQKLPHLFEPFHLVRPGAEEPGLSLCHTLARRLHAGVRAENRPQGGLALTFEFTPST